MGGSGNKSAKRLSFSERQEKILQTAVELFAEHGYEGTKTRDIAQKAGINEALIFRHYPSKEDLYSAILKYKLKASQDKMQNLLGRLSALNNKSAANELVFIAKYLVQENRKDPHLLRMMLFATLENHRLGAAFFRQRLPLMEFMENYFKRRFRKFRTRLSAADMARIYLSLVYHYIFITQIFGSPHFFGKSEAGTLKKFVSVFLKGVSA